MKKRRIILSHWMHVFYLLLSFIMILASFSIQMVETQKMSDFEVKSFDSYIACFIKTLKMLQSRWYVHFGAKKWMKIQNIETKPYSPSKSKKYTHSFNNFKKLPNINNSLSLWDVYMGPFISMWVCMCVKLCVLVYKLIKMARHADMNNIPQIKL